MPKIALVGSAPSSIHLAPWKDKSFGAFQQGKVQAYPPTPWINDEFEIWGCSPGAFGQLPRFTRFFELHRWEVGQPWFGPEYCQFLREFKGQFYTGGPVPEIKNHVVYPIERVEEEFSSYFLTSSLSQMAALAILEIEDYRATHPGHDHNDDVIGFWGIDCAANEEYSFQRPGVQFFILQAIERGIGVYVPPESDLLRPMPIYGLSEWDDNYIKLTARAKELNARRTQHQQNVANETASMQFLSGAMDDLNYMVNTWTSRHGLPAGQVIRKKPELLKPRGNGASESVASTTSLTPRNLDYELARKVWPVRE